MPRRVPITVIGHLAAVALFSVLGASAEARIWSSVSGTFKLDAELVEAKPNGVLILKKPDGQLLQVNVAKLSAADQQYVRSLGAGGAPLQHQPQPPRPTDLAAPAGKLRPVPDAAAAAAKLKEVRQLLADDYRQASKPSARQKLYQKLMGLARDALAEDPAGSYVMASEATAVGVEEGSVEHVVDGVTWLAERFEISDSLARKVELVKKIKIDSLAGNSLSEVADQLLTLMDEAEDAADYERSMEIGRIAAQAARKSRDQDLMDQVKARGTALKAQRETYEAVAAARKTLQESPQDKDANLTLGRFLALARGKWDAGLPRLSAGSNAELAALAKRDLARPAAANEQVTLADAWWTLGESPAYAQLPEIKVRAAYWYQQAAPQLTGLEKLRAEKRSAGREQEITNSIGMKLKLIPAGEFLMGSPDSEIGRRPDEGPQHRVRITRPFYMGIYPVTQSEYQQVMGNNPSWFSAKGPENRAVAGMDTSRFPVEAFKSTDVPEFLRRLSQHEHKKYRLPTEAEWEYACRAGNTTPFNFGETANGDMANCNGNEPYGTSKKGPHLMRTTAVGSYPPNAFGLYDMHGNVMQLCSDLYGQYYYDNSPRDNPKGPNAYSGPSPGGPYWVQRGGVYFFGGVACRSASRSCSGTGSSSSTGFRVVREP